MERTPVWLVSAHLLVKLLCITHLARPVHAHRFSSDIQIQTLGNSKHIEMSIDLQKEIATLGESIRQLENEIIMDHKLLYF